MTLREFIDTYEGFSFQDGEIVIVNQRQAKQFICKYRYIQNEFCFKLQIQPGRYIDEKWLELNVYSWTHTASTMLIVL